MPAKKKVAKKPAPKKKVAKKPASKKKVAKHNKHPVPPTPNEVMPTTGHSEDEVQSEGVLPRVHQTDPTY